MGRLGPPGPEKQVFVGFLTPLQKIYVFQGGLRGAPGHNFDGNPCPFLTFLLKFSKSQEDFPKSWRGPGPGRGLSGNQESLKYIEDCSTFGLCGGGGRRARERENILIFVGFYSILGVRAPERPTVKIRGGPAGDFFRKNSPTAILEQTRPSMICERSPDFEVRVSSPEELARRNARSG